MAYRFHLHKGSISYSAIHWYIIFHSIRHGAIVARKNNNRIFIQARLFHAIEQASYLFIVFGQHGFEIPRHTPGLLLNLYQHLNILNVNIFANTFTEVDTK